jgi:hypothetical protein
MQVGYNVTLKYQAFYFLEVRQEFGITFHRKNTYFKGVTRFLSAFL